MSAEELTVLIRAAMQSAAGRDLSPYTLGFQEYVAQYLYNKVNPFRPEVARFAEKMEAVLKRNDHKGGWTLDRPGNTIYFFIKKLKEETEELLEVMRKIRDGRELNPIYDDLESEAADVANIAMMIYDNWGKK